MARLQHFGWFLGHGFATQDWRTPEHRWGYRWYEPHIYQHAAQQLEQAGLDFLIIKDDLRTTPNDALLDLSVSSGHGAPRHDSLTLAPYILAATRHLGVAPSLNASIYPPFLAARQIASLHHLSGGRAAVNVVTSGVNPRDFGLDSLGDHDARLQRADEWVQVVRELWGSWEADAVLEDTSTGVYADSRKIHRIDHRGEYFAVEGPLNTLPFSDGGPVIAVPGGSPKGAWFSGRRADVQLAVGNTSEQIRATRERLHAEARAAGRRPEDMRVLFTFNPIVVDSEEEAEIVRRRIYSPTDEELKAQAGGLSFVLGIDLSSLDLDAPLPRALLAGDLSSGVLGNLLAGFDDPFAVPLRALLTKDGSGPGGGKGLVGTAEQIADHIERIGEETGNDGFFFTGDLSPARVQRVIGALVPVLRRRGILRTEYGGGSLRENLFEF